ncbi:hypothetical protein E4T81_08385 [Barnesiella sp. WM24]|uniref:FtsL-like putative cell division protein n=1 Tax=Barnesiella sp. WM24 TaxID=2558278 RepID=UPI001071FF83|nr:FtsL-like putative cell division protein [Barnesiella sp. WM24]MDE6113714.1 hypothetical protein [Muribaculum sp.]TFU93432.1 hypothetical protein E4T81_08385 [Barnesiella sp. WM24]
MAQQATKKKSDDNFLKKLIFGRILSLDFFKKHWVSVFVVVMAILIYITNRYQCLTRMEDIRKLEQELEIVETERIRERSSYMSRIRESSMQEMVDTMRLNLKIQDQPPYKLTKNESSQ